MKNAADKTKDSDEKRKRVPQLVQEGILLWDSNGLWLNGFSWFSAYSLPSMNRGVNENRVFISQILQTSSWAKSSTLPTTLMPLD
jgi:hypothetical protein